MSGEKNIARTTQPPLGGVTYKANKAYRAYGSYGAMRLMNLMGRMGRMGRLLLCFIMFNVQFSMFNVSAQITVGGNVYGGGNQANVGGNATVRVLRGDIQQVFGGARMANVGGRTYVNVDGEKASGDIFITALYGGNDIAGTIGTDTVPWLKYQYYTAAEATAYNTAHAGEPGHVNVAEGDIKAMYNLPGLTDVLAEGETNPKKNAIDDSWNVFVRTSRSTEEVNAKTVDNYPIIIGSLYGGGNGNYFYKKIAEDDYRIYNSEADYDADEDSYIAQNTTGFNVPEVAKTYLEIKGGEIAHLYGGGNNATVTENTTISIQNESDDLLSLCQSYVGKTVTQNEGESDDDYAARKQAALLSTLGSLQSRVQLNTFQSNLTSFAFNHARIYGGNNRAEMSIRPTWNLQQGIIRDLYSGGNQGDMTSSEGLLLEIAPVESEKLSVYNVYGGCRMADVYPKVFENGTWVYKPVTNLQDKDGSGNLIYKFPNELSARTLVRGGKITNVYGGNDIKGKVWGGNAIGVYTTIEGDVYGGGNGAYAYTNNETLKNNEVYSDFYYDSGSNAAEALNAHRPNAEQVSIRLKGTDAAHPTIIKGAVYCGGNCASLDTQKDNPMVELKIGSHVVADNVFMGNNGTKMVDSNILRLYASNVDNAGNIVNEGGSFYNDLDLTDPSVFATYMEGVSMDMQPAIVFDAVANGDPADYEDRTSYVGSFFCGGNVGSMAIPGLNHYRVTRKLNIYNKFVGGCNNADVAEGPYNAAYEGGVLGSSTERDNYVDGSGNIKDRLRIDLENLTITPLRWQDDTKTRLIWNTAKMADYVAVEDGTTLTAGKKYYTSDEGDGQFTAVGNEESDGTNYFEEYGDFVEVPNNAVDDDTRLLGGNMYGGCYNSGHVNGNIVININEDVLERENVFGNGTSFNGQPASGVELLNQRDDLDAVALILFGGGYGKETEVWGSVTVNHNNGYIFQICGGGEKGVVGKKHEVLDESGHFVEYAYDFDPAYSTTVNLQGTAVATHDTEPFEDLAETEYIYGGGKEGLVCGNTLVNLGNGRIYDALAGACEAEIGRAHV